MVLLSLLKMLTTLILILFAICHQTIADEWKISLESSGEQSVHMDEEKTFHFHVKRPASSTETGVYLIIKTEDDHIAIPKSKEILLTDKVFNPDRNDGSFTIEGVFLGRTTVHLNLVHKQSSKNLTQETINVKVVRPERVIDTIFVVSVATLVSIIYINFGCALNWGELRRNLKRPVGPIIGLFGQFVIMPLLSFGVGKVLFPDDPEMQLGFFFTGVAPGGGASNVWVAILDGNIDLCVTMTAVTNLASFGLIPFWVFTLGRVIFDQGNLDVPYFQITMSAVGLVIPLIIGYLIQRYLKKLSNFLVRILKVFSSLLIIFIIIFAIVTNLYLFELFSWKIVVAGLGLPWLGYILAYLLAKILRQNSKDSLTIAVETGIQNTGISVFLLRFALPQPEADITTVAPVSVATMTPLPLLILFIILKLRTRFSSSAEKAHLLQSMKADTSDLGIENQLAVTKDEEKNISVISRKDS